MDKLILYSDGMPSDNLTSINPFAGRLFDIFLTQMSPIEASNTVLKLIRDYYIGYCESDDSSKCSTFFWRLSNIFVDTKIGLAVRRGYIAGGLTLLDFDYNANECTFRPPNSVYYDTYSQYDDVLFGEHLTDLYPQKKTKVVANEVDAIIKAGLHSQYNWLAIGYGRGVSGGVRDKTARNGWGLLLG